MVDQSSLSTLAVYPHRTEQQAVDAVKMMANIVLALRKDVLQKDMDYGVIPGTGDKPTLLLPGMEKLMRALNAVPDYIERAIIRDYDKPLFHYEYECRLIDADTGLAIPGGRGIGLCTSMESAFRWREAGRSCPNCSKQTIYKSKDKPQWYCWKKKDGCGAVFPANDVRIMSQAAGRMENPDIFDQVNAIMKRAKKRALGDAIKGAANVSEFFTVDVEDFVRHDVIEGEYVEELPVNVIRDTAVQSVQPVSSWATTEAVGNLIAYCIDKLSITTADIERYTEIKNLKDVSAWAKYPDRATAALIIKQGVEKDAEAAKTEKPATPKAAPKWSMKALKDAVLTTIYGGNKFHMDASLSKLVSNGKLPPALTLDEAIAVVRDRHLNPDFEDLPAKTDADEPPVPQTEVPF